MVRTAINGLGRMGKLVLRNLIDTRAGGDAVLVNNRLSHRKTMLRSISFMALWVIYYDAIHNNVPRLPGFAVRPLSEIVFLAATWSGFLTLVPFAVAAACSLIGAPVDWFMLTLVAGLIVFGAVFAINNAIHSCLILAVIETERVTLDVGFCDMVNAAGRFEGTLLSGLSYQIGGLPNCLATAGTMAGLSFLLVRGLSG